MPRKRDLGCGPQLGEACASKARSSGSKGNKYKTFQLISLILCHFFTGEKSELYYEIHLENILR